MRSDETLGRRSFRYSEQWQRTGGSLSPQIDARLAGVEQRGDRLVVHSLSGGERNHYFANRQGRAFTDLSALSGMDSPLDSRGFAVLDYDRDGWQDVAMVNAGNPLFILYRNEIPASGTAHGGKMIALRFVGAADRPEPAKGKACRDGFGAKVLAELPDGLTLLREHRCGDGYAAQHSATMIVGLGAATSVKKLTVRWPSGAETVEVEVPEGTLVTVYENAAQSSDGKAVRRSPYRRSTGPTPPAIAPEPVISAFAQADPARRPDARLRLYSSMATWCQSSIAHLPKQQRLADELAAEGLDLVAVPIDPNDDPNDLAEYVSQHHPAYRLLSKLDAPQRAAFVDELSKTLGASPPQPASMVTTADGRVLKIMPGVPSISEVRRMMGTVEK